MPALRLDEVRLPELRLPEMSRDEIVRTLTEARPTVERSRLDPRRIDLAELDLPKVDLPNVDLAKLDLPKAMAAVAQTVGIVRAPRSRLPIVVGGLIAVAVIGAAVLTSPQVKPRLVEAARRWRERLDARRAERRTDATEPAAAGAMVAIPVEASTPVEAPRAEAPSPVDEPAAI